MNGIINLGYLFIATSAVIVIVGALNLKTLKRSLPLRVLFCLIVISLLSDLASGYMQSHAIHNLWLINLYNIIEYSLFAVFYLLLFKLNKNPKYIVGTLYLMGLIIIVITSFTQSFSEHLNSTLLGMKSIILICSSVFYFKVMLDEIEFETPWSNPFFWINSGVLIYFSGCFFIFIFSEYRGVSRTINLWDIHNIIHIIYNLLILIGFWKARKALTYSQS